MDRDGGRSFERSVAFRRSHRGSHREWLALDIRAAATIASGPQAARKTAFAGKFALRGERDQT
jgi:hypothetical protein